MKGFIEIAISAIMDHAKKVSGAARLAQTKTVYMMGAEHACDVLKALAESDDIEIVIRCRNCVYYDKRTAEIIDGLERCFCDVADNFVKATDFCSDAVQKEAD